MNCSNIDHCYSDIGCFPLTDEFYHPRHRPINLRPWPRKRINTRFELYNSKHPEGFQLLPWDLENVAQAHFDPKLETKIIVPGWLDNIKRAVWIKRMKDALLWHWQPVNIIVVHWRNFTPYTIAAANTRVVGAELANLLRWLEQHFRYNRAFHHLIGHSLGAHISGYCGDRLPGLGRITALDPARPFFQHMPKSVRLDRADAKFVDAIHSDFTPENAIFLLMSFGMTTPVGHLDFYPNGPPLLQPGCFRDSLLSVRNGIQRGLEHSSLSVAFLESIRYLTACDHQRSHEWFTESIMNRKCVFVGVRCDQFEGLINGRCSCDDSPSACAIMGINADQLYLHQLHQDLWPLAAKNAHKPPTVHGRPSAAPALAQWADDPPLAPAKDHIYAHYKEYASRLRQPPADIPEELNDLLLSLQEIQDAKFAQYLRSEIFMRDTQTLPLPRPGLKLAEDDLSDELGQDFSFGRRQEHFPKLLSDLDRDIETWYEDTSRWYLRTGKRPNYCVNQYQISIFIGPLSSTSGHGHLRANLVLSIVGSRGQLIKQRFVPRTKKLNPFTMQPFFILLEGSYSLGQILSVTIAWEARRDPDPIQATVSFQSSALEQLQSFWPTYKAKHPLFAETLALDRSKHFLPALAAPQAPLGPGQLLRRTSMLDHETGDSSISDWLLDASDPDQHPRECSLSELSANSLAGQCSLKQLQQEVGNEIEEEPHLGQIALEPNHNHAIVDALDLLGEPAESAGVMTSLNELTSDIVAPTSPVLVSRHHELSIGNVDELVHQQLGLTATLHNIPLNVGKANTMRQADDSLVVNEVLISPIHANYAKDGTKTARVFCPPKSGFRLRRDQTLKLSPSLVGKCRWARDIGN